MAFLRNRAVNWINLHSGIQALAQGMGGVFVLAYLLRAGVSVPASLCAMALIFAARFAIRPAVVPAAARLGLKPLLIFGNLVIALLDKEFRATRLQSSGGFLKQSNATIILGVEDADVDEVMGVVRTNCTSRTQVVNPMPPIMEPGEFFMPYPLEVEVGGATVFVLPVERFERL